MSKIHQYKVDLLWTGNRGRGTEAYNAYERSYTQHVAGKPDLQGSSDPAFRGDPSRYNPEELLVASLSSCHMLWFLHLCSEAGVSVVDYVDHAKGLMEEAKEGSGRFTEVVLHPTVTVATRSMVAKVDGLHDAAHAKCFIAASVNFPVRTLSTCAALE
ncbi:MAG TPA: OsmC family protein [Dinghuibacter sp.]|jgi:organic hydroperoxide reductase OsmC/OhrA|uniref:OsmC family protein n=1 Tax=Dinghuibacter sp. TaxID=2024697 RepID=UPI002CA64419|nr:OsmC family protein [Dinghuibacter sp.]HTJ15028.1 OsmC family protein [Dinghuibacter sp.]